MAPCAITATQSTENFEHPSHLPNYTHIHRLCPSILYPNTSDPTTNVFRSYWTSSDPYRTSSDPTRQDRILPALCPPATDPRGQRAYIIRGVVSELAIWLKSPQTEQT